MIIALVIVCFVCRYNINNITSKGKKSLVLLLIVCGIALTFISVNSIKPIYQDYINLDYVVVENAKVVVLYGSYGTIDRINDVVIYTNQDKIELKMKTDLKLDTNFEYFGTVAYLKHSKYLIWYDFDIQD